MQKNRRRSDVFFSLRPRLRLSTSLVQLMMFNIVLSTMNVHGPADRYKRFVELSDLWRRFSLSSPLSLHHSRACLVQIAKPESDHGRTPLIPRSIQWQR